MKIAITRAPLRVSFVGGGSDLSGGPGGTVSCSIDKYVYCVAKRRYDDKVYVTWREKQTCDDVIHVRHSLVRESLLLTGFRHGIEILTFADVPGVGSGLGSSAATTISVLSALYILKNEDIPGSEALAREAARVELKKLGRHGGMQDQYTSALGGVVHLTHEGGSVVGVERLEVNLQDLSKSFLLFSPGKNPNGRDSDDVLRGFSNTGHFRENCMRLCRGFIEELGRGRPSKRLGGLVHEHHMLKLKAFPGQVNGTLPYMDEDDYKDLSEISPTWKLCGAGSTGHLLVGCNHGEREKISKEFSILWGPELPFKFICSGVEIVYSE